MQVVYNYQYPSGSTNLYVALDAAKTKKPDIILNSGHLIEAIAITKAARDVRLDAAIFAYTSGPATPDFAQALGKDANYVYSGSQWSPQLQYKQPYSLLAAQFAAEYQKKAGTNAIPAYQVASATAAGLALQRAIERADSLDPERVRNALASLDLVTFFGRIKFDEHGQNVSKTVVIEQIQDGKLATVWRQRWPRRLTCTQLPPGRRVRRPGTDATGAQGPGRRPSTRLICNSLSQGTPERS